MHIQQLHGARFAQKHNCAQHYKPLVVDPALTSARYAWLRVTERSPSSALCAHPHKRTITKALVTRTGRRKEEAMKPKDTAEGAMAEHP